MKDVFYKLKIVEEEIKNRNKSDNLKRYNKGKKIHEKQMKFHKCQAKNRWVFGGNRTGKTECGAVEVVWKKGQGGGGEALRSPVGCAGDAEGEEAEEDAGGDGGAEPVEATDEAPAADRGELRPGGLARGARVQEG